MTPKEIERAWEIGIRANRLFMMMWDSMYPEGHCAVASISLAPLLRAAIPIDFRVAVGRAHDNRPHAWIESPDGDIIDPTYGQFTKGESLVVAPVHIALDFGHCPDLLLTLDQEEAMRRSIKHSYHAGPSRYEGWSAGSAIKALFHTNYPTYQEGFVA